MIPPMTRRTAEIACDANAYGDSLRPVDMIRLSYHVWMTGWAIDILNTGHDALPEFLLGCHPDVTQDRTCKLGKESLDGLSQEP